VPDALRVLVARFARTHGPFASEKLHARYRLDAGAVLRELERAGELVRGELRPGGSEREWCDVEVLRRLRRASLAALRKEIEPADSRALARFLPSWQGVDRHGAGGMTGSSAGIDRLREVLVPLQGLALPVQIWERDVLPRRIGAYSPAWLDSLCASGELVWVGAGSIGRSSGRVALYFREDAPLLGPPSAPRSGAGSTSATSAREHDRPEVGQLRERLAQGPCFFTDLLAELDVVAQSLTEALWDLVWAGEATNDAWAPLRAPHLTLARGARATGAQDAWAGRAGAYPRRSMIGRSRFGVRRRGAQAQVQGRWSLTDGLFAEPTDRRPSTSMSSSSSSSPSSSQRPPSARSHSSSPGPGSPSVPLPSNERRRALAELLLERYGIVTREQVLAEGIRGGFALLYDAFSKLETLGVCRRGYFIEGMGGAQFALPGAVERLRAARTSPAAGASERGVALVIAAADPAQPYGAALPWPKREGHDRRPARVAGAYVVMVADLPALYVERGGRGLVSLADAPLDEALHALAEAVRAGRVGKLALERIDGEPAIASPLAQELIDLGFHSGPRKLTLSA
jgi:ATP-dependent Lhr-like helicase